ncbi:Uncharacterised protein [Acidipropionibacterium jensenii]|uniref:Uncharacterized protein n=1 Tax=Acidipropionibacterium jensenii TaxID=1749 RepID=A0A3S4V8C7_9ACTN|nr:Uncharacterised protein [Acidipropionibacterium jensenii]
MLYDRTVHVIRQLRSTGEHAIHISHAHHSCRAVHNPGHDRPVPVIRTPAAERSTTGTVTRRALNS